MAVTVDDVLSMMKQLSPKEKLQVIAQTLPDIESQIADASADLGSIRSLRGLLADSGPAPSAEDIDEVRREMLANFPRDDI